MTDTVTVAQFIEVNRLSMTCERISARTDRHSFQSEDERKWDAQSFHFVCTITRSDAITGYAVAKMAIQYSQGAAHVRPMKNVRPEWDYRTSKMIRPTVPTLPELANVLDSLASDASGYLDARDYADFASNYGYDEDSRKGESVYRACGKIADELRQLLGREALDVLLHHVERL